MVVAAASDVLLRALLQVTVPKAQPAGHDQGVGLLPARPPELLQRLAGPFQLLPGHLLPEGAAAIVDVAAHARENHIGDYARHGAHVFPLTCEFLGEPGARNGRHVALASPIRRSRPRYTSSNRMRLRAGPG